MRKTSFTRSIDLSVGAGEFLDAFTLHRVNDEMRPLVRMTSPAGWSHRPVTDWPEKQHLFASWILLFGLLPIDRHAFYFQSIVPGEGFTEDSSSTMNRHWRHQRRVTPMPGGCRVTDSVAYECRLPLLGVLLKPVYELVFRQRHRNLRSVYGEL